MTFTKEMIQMVNPCLGIILLLLVYIGYKKGFISKLLSSISFLVIVIVGWKLAPSFADVFKILPKELAPYQDTPLADFFYTYTNQILIFVLIIVIASVFLFLLKPIAQIFKVIPGISFVNAVCGSFLGVVETVILSFVLLFVLHSPMITNGNEVIDNTVFKYVDSLQSKVLLIGNDVIKQFDVISDSIDQEASAIELKQFLSEHGFSEKEIQDFILNIGK